TLGRSSPRIPKTAQRLTFSEQGLFATSRPRHRGVINLPWTGRAAQESRPTRPRKRDGSLASGAALARRLQGWPTGGLTPRRSPKSLPRLAAGAAETTGFLTISGSLGRMDWMVAIGDSWLHTLGWLAGLAVVFGILARLMPCK